MNQTKWSIEQQVYLDGVCFGNSTRVAKAAAGIVQEVGSSARYNKMWYGLSSYLDHTSVVAEIFALLVAIVQTPIGQAFTFVTDCAAVL